MHPEKPNEPTSFELESSKEKRALSPEETSGLLADMEMHAQIYTEDLKTMKEEYMELQRHGTLNPEVTQEWEERIKELETIVEDMKREIEISRGSDYQMAIQDKK